MERHRAWNSVDITAGDAVRPSWADWSCRARLTLRSSWARAIQKIFRCLAGHLADFDTILMAPVLATHA